MAYQYIDTLSIPSPEEIAAINELLDTLLGMLIDGDIAYAKGLWIAATVADRFEQLGVAIPEEES